MTTDPSSHRAQADDFLGDALQMSNLEDLDVGDAVGLGILHGILALHDLIAGISDDDLAGEEQHQSEMFETHKSAGGWLDRPELDEDNPDSLAEWVDGDTVVRGPLPYPWGAA